MALVAPSLQLKLKKNRQLLQRRGGNRGGASNRFLITVTVLGSAGPIRFLVNEGEVVTTVISTALKSYARQGRLPVLGSDFNNFVLYSGSDALSPWKSIDSRGTRNFVLCKKERMVDEPASQVLGRKGSGSWRTWLNKSLSFGISFP